MKILKKGQGSTNSAALGKRLEKIQDIGLYWLLLDAFVKVP